jgi:hypothetical protein
MIVGQTAGRKEGDIAMSTFDEREQGYERKFQLEQETAFKIKARANKLLGHWAAAQLGFKDAAAEAYALELVAADLAPRGDDILVEKLIADFAAKGLSLDATRIHVEIKHCITEAKRQLGLTS